MDAVSKHLLNSGVFKECLTIILIKSKPQSKSGLLNCSNSCHSKWIKLENTTFCLYFYFKKEDCGWAAIQDDWMAVSHWFGLAKEAYNIKECRNLVSLRAMGGRFISVHAALCLLRSSVAYGRYFSQRPPASADGTALEYFTHLAACLSLLFVIVALARALAWQTGPPEIY